MDENVFYVLAKTNKKQSNYSKMLLYHQGKRVQQPVGRRIRTMIAYGKL